VPAGVPQGCAEDREKLRTPAWAAQAPVLSTMEYLMTPTYMPFTYLSESTARILKALVGPVVIYQPLKSNIHEHLSKLASQGLVEIRIPITQDDDRLRAALAEFTEWARMNPGKSTPGAGFYSQRQGEVPFFDETAIDRIRSDINRYQHFDPLADHETQKAEAEFSARLFLTLAQENDQVSDHLEHDLSRFNALEKDFLNTLTDNGETGFSRQSLGAGFWRDDPGAKLTGQRMRAWATLAQADATLPELLITTSPAVIDSLLETHGDALRVEKRVEIHLDVPAAGEAPALHKVLADLADQASLPSADFASVDNLAADAASETAVTVTLFVAANQTPDRVIRRMAAATPSSPDEIGQSKLVRHTVIIMVES
jgi:hypothetical protein